MTTLEADLIYLLQRGYHLETMASFSDKRAALKTNEGGIQKSVIQGATLASLRRQGFVDRMFFGRSIYTGRPIPSRRFGLTQLGARIQFKPIEIPGQQ